MTDSLLKKSTCKITCGDKSGTGFFISPNWILTAIHVINESFEEEKKIEVSNWHFDENTHIAKCIYHDDHAHIAIIEINEICENDCFLELLNADIIKDEIISIYGYPRNFDGEIVGEPLSGKVLRYIEDSDVTIHDVSINVDGFDTNSDYSGFSGSPVVNGKNQVLSFIRFKSERYLSAISIKKAAHFLQESGMSFSDDELKSFSNYKHLAFSGFETLKVACEKKSEKALSVHSPFYILQKKSNDMFYPAKMESFEDIRAYLKNNRNVDKELWVGWTKFLTYIQMLDGNFENIEDVNINVSLEILFKTLGFINRKKSMDLKVSVDFMFTEHESFITVASEVLHNQRNSEEIKGSVCTVFNSNSIDFGIKKINTRHVINDIGMPDGSGPNIVRPKSGVVSLRQLTDLVIMSDNIEDAKSKLKGAIEDAIN
ncbi:S1 family peptidase [Aliivibrio kagoshimensis]|uniref:S1 family peptidase n=1 Tax=Aliivibrio kagoshimensis TaxID=2910230 RepID=UPI003D126E41